MTKRIISLLAVLALTVCLFAGCGPKQPAQEPTDATGDVPAATDGVQPAADPATGASDGTLQLAWNQTIGVDTLFESPWHNLLSLYPYMVFEPLVCLDEARDSQYIGRLASDYTISEDGLTYTFTLRDGALFSDGSAVTADDVVFSFYGKLADPNSNYKTELLSIQGADAVMAGEADAISGVKVDGSEIIMTLTAPNKNFLFDVARTHILPAKEFEGVEPAKFGSCDFWKMPYGSGQYKITEVSFPDYFLLAARDDYWGEKAGIANVQFTSYDVGGNDATVAAMISGTLDYAYGEAVNDIEIADNITAQNPNVTAPILTSAYSRIFEFNMVGSADGGHNDGVKKKEVRQAISLLIDKESIASMYSGQAEVRTTFVPTSSPMYNDDIAPFAQNVEKAKELLSKAGFDYSKKIRICYYYDDQTTADIMDLVVQNLAAGGITAEASLATGDLAEILYGSMNYDMMYFGATNSDPVLLYKALTVGGGEDPVLGDEAFRTETFNTLMNEYLASSDEDMAKAAADELQAAATDYCGMFPAYGLNKLCLINTSRVSIPEVLFSVDNEYVRDYHFEDWHLNG